MRSIDGEKMGIPPRIKDQSARIHAAALILIVPLPRASPPSEPLRTWNAIRAPLPKMLNPPAITGRRLGWIPRPRRRQERSQPDALVVRQPDCIDPEMRLGRGLNP